MHKRCERLGYQRPRPAACSIIAIASSLILSGIAGRLIYSSS